MKWYYTIRGGHTHVRVFMNGANCGELCFRNEEFQAIKNQSMSIKRCGKPEMEFKSFVNFEIIDETPQSESPLDERTRERMEESGNESEHMQP